MRSQVTVSIIEPHQVIAAPLFLFLKGRCELRAGTADSTVEVALKKMARHPPTVLLMDLDLPQRSVLSGLRWLKANLEETKIAVLSGVHELERVFQAFKAGADAWFLKEESVPQLIEDILELLRDGSPISAAAARRLVLYFRVQGESSAPGKRLSLRELEIVEHLARGLSDKEIANRLRIALTTVNDHLRSVYRKFGAHSRAEAVAKYLNLRTTVEPAIDAAPRERKQNLPATKRAIHF